MDENTKWLILFFAGTLWPLAWDVIKKIWNEQRDRKEQNKIDSETTNNEAEARLAKAETITERNKADEIYVNLSRKLMEDMEKVFEERILAMEERQKIDIEIVTRKQIDTDNQLELIRKENETIKQENQKIKMESLELHQENLQLKGIITKLQQAIKGLKKIIEKFMSGINKLISVYEKEHKDETIPWKPVLTDEEQLLFQSDFDFKDLKSYKE